MLREGWVVLAFIVILSAIVLPIPALLLDLLLALSITFSMTVLVLSSFIKEPLELSAFPSILLLGTLLRLSLNIAAARRILLYGHEGTSAAGHIIEGFGTFVVGGDVVVGLVVFLIFIVINFVVITRGAERVSEVAARFTLDAMPGKQMSIDADLNAGLITEEEARRRRSQLEQEASFYGAMDGASKFIRGDAVAALIILFLSLVGGLVVGLVFKGLGFSEALRTYTLLTVGEGLASQIPALMLSTSAGVVVTKSSSKEELGKVLFKEFSREPRVFLFSSGLLLFIGLIPGFPKLPFFLMAGVLGGLYYTLRRALREEELKRLEEMLKEQKRPSPEKREEEFITQPEPIVLEIGYGLIPYMDETQGGDVPERIKAVRRQLAGEYGVVIPLVHIRDNLRLRPHQYRILIRGIEVDSYEIVPGHWLAIDLGGAKETLQGIETKDPSFRLKAYWIREEQRERAQRLGYMVVDISTLILTHISETIKKNLHEILGRSEVMELVENLSRKYPKAVQGLVPDVVPVSVLHRVLQNLLREGIPINDLLTIMETLADYIEQTRDPDTLTEFVRQRLSKRITRIYATNGTLYATVIAPKLETKLTAYLQEGKEDEFLDLLVNRLYPKLSQELTKFNQYQAMPLVITSGSIRRHVRKVLENYIPTLTVLSYNELDRQLNLKVIGVIDED
ncbi:MAG: flagellar biosynthesis protein FlhA [Aquificaceae bacterium]|nr:flagellar biosynthesis protein FlhA [Aquificaceae bacterium]MCX7990326.1 flagellar biosynthesis protein FlhA [Aquificaceae bacterium]MDW8032771.1 flagellar biosynthesis protein FlhA [Aquificaceae bacterium]MDW8294919.1 flagellar biosynthesis protein FlhA [Aquificaceae bacterium]